MTIKDIFLKYFTQIDRFDLEFLIAHELKKPREFVLAHPEARVAPKQELRIKNYVSRRRRGEPLAYILGHKEFFGLDFKVNRNTLTPRPETELLVELAIQELRIKNNELSKIQNTKYQLPATVIDVGTGSGNIIISLAKLLESRIINQELRFFGTDISKKALAVAKYNAKRHGVDKKIKFLQSNLLEKIGNVAMKQCNNLMILANLPYLSPAIYKSIMRDVKKYEPKSALLSSNRGLAHYEKLLAQAKKLCVMCYVLCVFMEISPEQKPRLAKLIKKRFPKAKIDFFKDLAGKWRICRISA